MSVNGTRTVNVALSSPTGGTALASPTTAVVTISENHPPTVTGTGSGGSGSSSGGSSSGGTSGSGSSGGSGSSTGSSGSSTGSQTPSTPHYTYVKIGKHIVRILVGGTYQNYYNPYYWYNRGRGSKGSVVVAGFKKKKG